MISKETTIYSSKGTIDAPRPGVDVNVLLIEEGDDVTPVLETKTTQGSCTTTHRVELTPTLLLELRKDPKIHKLVAELPPTLRETDPWQKLQAALADAKVTEALEVSTKVYNLIKQVDEIQFFNNLEHGVTQLIQLRDKWRAVAQSSEDWRLHNLAKWAKLIKASLSVDQPELLILIDDALQSHTQVHEGLQRLQQEVKTGLRGLYTAEVITKLALDNEKLREEAVTLWAEVARLKLQAMQQPSE